MCQWSLSFLLIDFLLQLQLQWNPKSTLEVTQEHVDLLFKPFPDAEELLLPSDQEPRFVTWFSYDWAENHESNTKTGMT